jgi:ribosomal protein S18 acetylase RimI-like enzyme
MSFRLATLADLPALLGLQQKFYEEEGYPYDRAIMNRGMRELLGDPNLGRLFLAGDPPLAYLVVTFGFSLEFGGRDAFVDELYVSEAARRQGIGAGGLLVAEDACREAGIRALHLEVEHVNTRARALYERIGYETHDRHLMTKRF